MNDICCVVVQKQMKETEASTFFVRLLEYTSLITRVERTPHVR